MLDGSIAKNLKSCVDLSLDHFTIRLKRQDLSTSHAKNTAQINASVLSTRQKKKRKKKKNQSFDVMILFLNSKSSALTHSL